MLAGHGTDASAGTCACYRELPIIGCEFRHNECMGKHQKSAMQSTLDVAMPSK